MAYVRSWKDARRGVRLAIVAAVGVPPAAGISVASSKYWFVGPRLPAGMSPGRTDATSTPAAHVLAVSPGAGKTAAPKFARGPRSAIISEMAYRIVFHLFESFMLPERSRMK